MHQLIASKGDLPSDADGEVNRTACIVGFAGPCSKTIKIQVKSCGNFRVYHLVPAPQTSTGYCIGIFFFLSFFLFALFFKEEHFKVSPISSAFCDTNSAF